MPEITIDPKTKNQVVSLPFENMMELLSTICSVCEERKGPNREVLLMASILTGYGKNLYEQVGCSVQMKITHSDWNNSQIEYDSNEKTENIL